MSEKTRKWKKSNIKIDHVNQNTENAKKFVELTEKYKTLGSQIENKIDSLFNFLGNNFGNFNPNLTVQEEFERLEQKEQIKIALMKSIIPEGLVLESILNSDLENYAKTLIKKDPFSISLLATKKEIFAQELNNLSFKAIEQRKINIEKLAPYYQLSSFSKIYNSISPVTIEAIKKIGKIEVVKSYLETLKNSLEQTDYTNIDQLKSAINIYGTENTHQYKEILEEWLKKVEARDFFFKTTEELHNVYEAFLELDTRAETTATEFLADKVTELLSGAKAFIKKTEETSESLGNKFVKTFSDLFGFGKKETDEDEEVIDLSVSKEVAVHTSKSSLSNIVKTVEAGSNDSIEQVDNEYQTIMDQLITAKKVICFSNVMQVTKAVSSCLIRKPFEEVTNDNKTDCESLDVTAKNAMAQCDYMFPFATNSDNVISDFLSKASRVELNIYENGQTGLKSHVDEVVSDLTRALGEAVVQQYKLLPAASNQDVMQAEYEKNVYDVSFSHDNTNNAILLGNSNHDTIEL